MGFIKVHHGLGYNDSDVAHVFMKQFFKNSPFILCFTGEYRMYGRRWIILAIFTLYSASNALQWIQYSIIANIVEK